MLRSRLRLWWQKTSKLLVIVELIVLIAVLSLIFAGYFFKWSWTGFNEQVGPQVQQYQPAKTLWDWLQLLSVLSIAAAVEIGIIWFAKRHGQISEVVIKHGLASEAIIKDNQREATLQAYIDKISELLLHDSLRDSAEETEARMSLPRFGRVSKAEVYSTKPGKELAWQKFKKPTRKNSKKKRSDWCRPVASPSHKLLVS